MQSIFLACYFCLQLIALYSQDKTALALRDSSCDQCLTGVAQKLHLSPDLAIQIEDWLSIKKPTTKIVSNSLAIAEAVAKLVQEQMTSTAENLADEAQQKRNEFLGKRGFLRINEWLKVGEFLISENQRYFATLNSDGRLVLTDTDDTVLDKLGCRNEEESQDYSMLFDFDNSVKFYQRGARCSLATPMGCNRYGVRCYLNLDNDGRLRMYSGDRHFEYLHSHRVEPSAKSQQNEAPEPQQVKESQIIEYKGRSTLKGNERLAVGDSLVSENGKFKSTFSRQGQLETYNSRGKLIRISMGCNKNIFSDDWILAMPNDSGTLTFYWNKDGDDMHKVGNGNTGSAGSYLKLDNGLLKMFDKNGHLKEEYMENLLDSPYHIQMPDPQQAPIEEGSQEIEYHGRSILKRNERLTVGQSLVSENGKYNATLNHYGKLEIFNSRGRLLGKTGVCEKNPQFGDNWNILMHPKNLLVFCLNDYCPESFGPSYHCSFSDVECFIKLDNDGLIKMFDSEGKLEEAFGYCIFD